MTCPHCLSSDIRVIDSRDVENEPSIRRRRECAACAHRFTTYERIEVRQLWVIKKDQRREQFDREKLARGIWRACEKRPVAEADIEKVILATESHLRERGETEIPVEIVGEVVMEQMKHLDDIAYIRFASVYRQFADLGELQKEVRKTLRDIKASPPAGSDAPADAPKSSYQNTKA